MLKKEKEKGKKTQDEMGICVISNQGGGAKPSLPNGNNDVLKEKCVY
jgi:hypothetical protein